MLAIKAFKSDMTTGGIGGSKYTEFKVGKTYEVTGKPELCSNGFHFFRKQDLCFGIDYHGEGTILCEIEVLGAVKQDTFKLCTNKMKIVRRIPKKEWSKLLDKQNNSGNRNSGNYNSGNRNSGDYNSGGCNSGGCNSGHYNSGNYNSGDYNSGNRNSGDYNSGYYNSGDYNSGGCNSGNYNSGDYNSGYYNSGYYNSGNRNSGDYNSGDYNSGHYNSGDYNSGDYNSGNGYHNYFCTRTKYFLFDIEVKEIPSKLRYLDMSWFSLENKSYKEAWKQCPMDILETLSNIPEFQTDEAKKKFTEITGLTLPKPSKKETK
jgi:hypothetical protein